MVWPTDGRTADVVSLMGRGVVVTTISVSGAHSQVPSELRDEAVATIESGVASAVCFTPGGEGQWVLAAPADVILVDAAALQGIDPNLISCIDGKGGGDPRTAMLDLQWRLNLNGHRVLALDGSVAPHRSLTVGDEQARVASILTSLTILPGSALRGPITSVAELYLLSGALKEGSVDTSTLDLQRSPGGDDVDSLTVPASSLAAALGLDAALDNISGAESTRASVQLHRRVPDRALTPLMPSAVAHFLGAETATDHARLGVLLDVCAVRPALLEPLHVLVVAPGEGPARDRAVQLGQQLPEGVTMRFVEVETGQVLEGDTLLDTPVHEQPGWADVMVLIAATFDDLPGAAQSDASLVIDLSCVDVIAWLVDGPPSGHRSAALGAMLLRADLVLASDGRQRDLLLGALAGQERVNAAVYDEDPSLASLVRTDPSGQALEEFCRRPVRAADSNLPPFVAPTKQSDIALAVKYLREGGPAALAERVTGRLRRVYKRTARELR
jgi:hypothetical protein